MYPHRASTGWLLARFTLALVACTIYTSFGHHWVDTCTIYTRFTPLGATKIYTSTTGCNQSIWHGLTLTAVARHAIHFPAIMSQFQIAPKTCIDFVCGARYSDENLLIYKWMTQFTKLESRPLTSEDPEGIESAKLCLISWIFPPAAMLLISINK